MTPALERPTLRATSSCVRLKFLDQLLIRASFVQRVEVFTVQILYQRFFQTHRVVGLVNERRYRLESCTPRRTEATFSCDQLVFVRPDLSHQDWLKDANRLDRVDKRGQALLPKLVTRLERVRADASKWHLTKHGTGGNSWRLGNERP